jgi:hypothetical protein
MSLIDYQRNLTNLLEHPELLKPLFGKKKKKKGFKSEVVHESNNSLHEEGLTRPQVYFLDALDEGVLAPKHDEYFLDAYFFILLHNKWVLVLFFNKVIRYNPFLLSTSSIWDFHEK